MERTIMKDPVFLAQKSAPATAEDLPVAQDLLDTLIAHRDGCVGVAANMIGVSKRIIVFDNDGAYMTMFNPEIIKYAEPYEAEEGCLSLEGKRKTKRFTNNQLKEMSFPDRDYAYPEAPGKAMAKLVMKRWGRNNVLICYFDADDGRKLRLCVWFSDKPSRCYRPKDGKIDMSYVEIGSRMYIEYDVNYAGHARFLKAELID